MGGGENCWHWLEQFKELGEVQVEEVHSRGFKCFGEGGTGKELVARAIHGLSLPKERALVKTQK